MNNDHGLTWSTDPPDAVVFIDYPGFNLKTAGFIKQHYDIPVCYYIAPKVWAWNSRRLDTIAKVTDHVAMIFPFLRFQIIRKYCRL